MALIACRDASFDYDGNIAVCGLNFQVCRGDYLCVVGENGSGKTTLIKGLLRLKPPRQGSVVTGEGLKLNQIGYMPQQWQGQKDFPASVYEVIISGRLSNKPFYSKRDKEAVEEVIKQLKLDSLRNLCYREISGGQQQQVLLARALCSAKTALLLDEPASGLDQGMAREVYKRINTINKEKGLTVVMVSHDIQSAVQYASHILHLNKTQVFFGRTEDYVRSGAGREFLGMGSERHD